MVPGIPERITLFLILVIPGEGGLTPAYHAWKDTENQSSGYEVSNYTADRQFFFVAAQMWRANYREEALRNQVYTDPHTTARYRVDGALFNIPEFYDAFPEIQPGDALYRNVSEKQIIW